jgi:2-iminoacetate synthase ThiH
MNDHLYEEFFTIYLKYTPKKKEDAKNEEAKKEKIDAKLGVRYSYNPIYSITRICAYNCKGY